MKAASLKEIKSELLELGKDELLEYCLRLSKFKKENKELLTYLIFGSVDEAAYVQEVKDEIELEFKSVSKGHVFFAKKTLRKILRLVNRQSRYSDQETTELELRIFFCAQMITNGITISPGTVIFNMYQQQLKKINILISKLPEDLQYDYELDVTKLTQRKK